MATQIERVIAELRRRILAKELSPGERITELHFSSELGVSRTPLRLALVELERQGLVQQAGKRGFCIRHVTLEEVAQAIDVRGVLEGMAARLLAEEGVSKALLQKLKDGLQQGRQLIDEAALQHSDLNTAKWAAMNASFHQLILRASGNQVLISTLEHVFKSPLASPEALGFSGHSTDLELSFIERAQTDHEDLVAAIEAHEGTRAEALMREHAKRSRDNKRLLITLQ